MPTEQQREYFEALANLSEALATVYQYLPESEVKEGKNKGDIQRALSPALLNTLLGSSGIALKTGIFLKEA